MNRAEETTEVKVYSNQPEVSLYVDGALVGTQQGSRVFTFRIPLSGQHKITAQAGACEDAITIKRVAQPDASYQFGERGGIVNWFDQDDFKPGFFSIKDTLGALLANPGTAPIVGAMMQKAQASRGDVAKSTAGNANLQKMLNAMPLESLLKQAGDAVPPEAVKQLNAALQKVAKG